MIAQTAHTGSSGRTNTLSTDSTKSAQIAEILKAMAHPLRLQIIAILCERDEHVNALADRLGCNQSVVSQQLRILRMRGLVDTVRDRGFAKYFIAEPKLRDMIACMEGCSIIA